MKNKSSEDFHLKSSDGSNIGKTTVVREELTEEDTFEGLQEIIRIVL